MAEAECLPDPEGEEEEGSHVWIVGQFFGWADYRMAWKLRAVCRSEEEARKLSYGPGIFIFGPLTLDVRLTRDFDYMPVLFPNGMRS